jgi:HSP20 family protein
MIKSNFFIGTNSFNELLNDLFSEIGENKYNPFIPYFDIIENNDDFIFDLMLAGFDKNLVNVSVEKNTLVIKGERKEDKSLKYNTKRSFFGNFEKLYELPEYVDKENIKASFENGVLRITIPKAKNKTSGNKMIEIK